MFWGPGKAKGFQLTIPTITTPQLWLLRGVSLAQNERAQNIPRAVLELLFTLSSLDWGGEELWETLKQSAFSLVLVK